MAVAEMCIASQIGATITESENGRLFSEDLHCLIAVMERGTVDRPGLQPERGNRGRRCAPSGRRSSRRRSDADRHVRRRHPRRMTG